MKTIAWGMLAAALAYVSGCARPDWIEQTLVTVDVTGTWRGSAGAPPYGATYEFVLKQEGPKVQGFVQQYGMMPPGVMGPNFYGPIEGTLTGDVFSFRQTNGPLTGETTVSGDEMIGEVSRYRVILRRVDSSSRPTTREP